jgi:hypothetical protein
MRAGVHWRKNISVEVLFDVNMVIDVYATHRTLLPKGVFV